MIKKMLYLIPVLTILIGCTFIEESYPNREGHYIINSINTETANFSESGEVDISVNGMEVNIYSMLLDNDCGAIAYSVDGEMKSIDCLNDKAFNNCYIASTSLTSDGGEIIGLLQVPRTRDGGYDSFQRYLKYDLLFKLNPLTNESQIIYQTEDKHQRIVGYNEGKAYLYENNCIVEVDIDTNKKELLKVIEPYEKLEFDWTDEGLAIDNFEEGYHELIEI